MKTDRRASLSFTDFKEVAEFFNSSGPQTVGLLGGEPTLNPDFLKIVDWAVQKGISLRIYSNLIFSKAIADVLKTYSNQQIDIVVNVFREDRVQLERIHPRLLELSHLVTLTIAIDRPDFEWLYLIDLIKNYALKRTLRLKLALPVLWEKNVHLKPTDYKQAASTIVNLGNAAESAGVRLEFGCGFVKCMFTAEQLKTLTSGGHQPSFTCAPIVDVDTKGQASHCLPLSNLPNLNLKDYKNFDDIVGAFNKKVGVFRAAGMMDACRTCEFLKDGSCRGGCLGFTLDSFKKSGLEHDARGVIARELA